MSDVSIAELFAQQTRPLLSYEFFPPRTSRAKAALERSIEELRKTEPDFVTVTWGAGGSTRDRTLQVAESLQAAGMQPVMPHLTCVKASRIELREIAADFHARGFRNIMTLRGDHPENEPDYRPPVDGLAFANELVELLKQAHPDFCCGVAGYPETHPEATDAETDIRHLKRKVDAGASFITTQLFFDNTHYFRFVDRCRTAGIDVPILPGLLPASSLKQVDRFLSLCGASFPSELREAMSRMGGEGPDAAKIGLDWCNRQIDNLLDGGAPGIHLYILNRSDAPQALDLARLCG